MDRDKLLNAKKWFEHYDNYGSCFIEKLNNEKFIKAYKFYKEYEDLYSLIIMLVEASELLERIK